ncbi:MAG: hypothetical protein PVG66_08000 [Chromatiales bacterium]
MHNLIQQVRQVIPFDLPEARVCSPHGESCIGCPQKLLEYLEMELDNWQDRLQQGEVPNFGDLDKLAKSSKKIHAIMVKNGLIGVD